MLFDEISPHTSQSFFQKRKQQKQSFILSFFKYKNHDIEQNLSIICSLIVNDEM